MRVRSDLTLTYTATTEARPQPEAELAIFRIVQESLANALKHAGATAVAVTDSGAGFDPATGVRASADGASGGMGLRSMRERAAVAGLTLDLVSVPGAGTTIQVAASLRRHSANGRGTPAAQR